LPQELVAAAAGWYSMCICACCDCVIVLSDSVVLAGVTHLEKGFDELELYKPHGYNLSSTDRPTANVLGMT